MAKKVLGRGLDALIEESGSGVPEGLELPVIEISRIETGRHQPRKGFDQEKIKELAESIRKIGLIQPIVVTQSGEKYRLIVGERRLRAAKIAGLKEIPAFVKEYSENKYLEIALIENIQREDLNPIEEATAYKMILDREQITQEELSGRIGKSRSYIANMIRLLDLPENVKEHVSRGTISVGQAKAVLSLPDAGAMEKLVSRILDEQLTVRDVEQISRKRSVPRGTSRRAEREKDPHIDEIEERLRTRLGTKVTVDYRGGKGYLRIEFYSEDDLERILGEILG
jgi:ParB family chromosome partitioning protein